MRTVTSLARWFCSLITRDELARAIEFLLEVYEGTHDDIKFKSRFRENHPNYRLFDVDTNPPSTQPPADPVPPGNWRELLVEHERRRGKPLPPVKPRGGIRPPSSTRCEHCDAPANWLSINDGKKRSQVVCKICKALSPIRRIRRKNPTPFWCPHCKASMYEWKHDDNRTIYKCGNDKCPHYLAALKALNSRERELAKTGMSSQFKLRYQWRSYHFDPSQIRPHAPGSSPRSLLNVRRNLEVVGLALAYAVSLGLSSRLTAQVLRDIHGEAVSHQTVLNWLNAAAGPAWQTLVHTLKGTMHEVAVAGDETYIKVKGVWHYTWFLIGTETRTIWAWEVSEGRGEMPAIAVLNQAIGARPKDVEGTLVFVGDGNPSYDAAVNAINTDSQGMPLDREHRKIERRTVVGLRNDDAESTQFRPFKQLVERLNRTYRYHTRSRSGHKTLNGARALTTLFVLHYNFLRKHRSLGNRPPIHLPELDQIKTLQGRWLKLLQLTA
ncbi:MAG: DDE-type integrase/transposase/recombinase [Candidatus Nealsonbacteria bacterium]|nr:DDE-type integrase/transposase/recombinase [Candidatus Nealsonbacteria bacterium]